VSVERRGVPSSLNAAEAGAVLGLPADVVRVLADAGYLRPSSVRGVTPRFALNDLKAFQARVDDHPDVVPDPVWGAAVDEDLEGEILDAVRGQVPRMAQRTFELFAATVTGVPTDGERRERFESEAAERIGAIIEVCARGPIGDEPLLDDLAGIGGDAARAGVPLPGVLVALRTTRDIVVRTAVEVAEARGRHWGLALNMVLTRVLPSIDRLSDAVARGYWEAILEIEVEATDRYRNVIEQASDGVVELDADGIVRYANPAVAELLGSAAGDLVDRPVADVLPPVSAGESDAVIDLRGGADGRRLRVRQFERIHDGVITGWDVVVVLEP
jgi:PAS domain S-box-containing protein